ncbi:MAG TPA: PspA/IM30 family protein [Bryobacteraceae bacterium]|jgi:phage shock protein A|nr:PspA/IM30 family protein [Bryobacteraceae bacterium]
MALLERVATLIRANLNDLIDRAEEPERMLKQVILDMENQLLQVKTQVAISIADQHVLDRKLRESEQNEKQWVRRAESALDKEDEKLARAAVERSMSYQSMTVNLKQQVEDQKSQVENLKTALLRLQQKLEEAKARSQALIAEHRRSRAAAKAGKAGAPVNGGPKSAAAFDRMKDKVRHTEATAAAVAEMAAEDVEDQFAQLEKEAEINRLLDELKARRRAG